MLVHRMQDHARVLDGLAICVFENNEIDLAILLVASYGEQSDCQEEATKDCVSAHRDC